MPNVRLSWNPNPAEQLVHAYEVFEKVDNGPWDLVATVTEPTRVFTPSGGVRNWKVRAKNFVGGSDFSPVANGPPVPTPPGKITVTIE